MDMPITNENFDEKNTILPCKDNLKIYFDGQIEINGNDKIEDNRLKFDFGPIRVNTLNTVDYNIPYGDYVLDSNGIGIRLFNKFGVCNLIHYEYEITKEQYNILQNNFVDTIINMLNDDHSIFDFIGEDIISRLYSLGWRNHDRYIKFKDGSSLNVSDSKEISYTVKRPYYNYDGKTEIEEENIVLPSEKLETNKTTDLNTKIIQSSCIIQTVGRLGDAKYLILDQTNFSVLSENANFCFEPITNDNKIHIPNIKKVGKIYGKDVYVNESEIPFILVGRNEESETGLTFLPYYIEPIGYLFKDDKIKLVFSIRYAIADLGFFPELNYLLFYHE